MQHPDTLTSVYCLAYLLHKGRRYEEASRLYQRACNGYSQKLSSQHPTTVACRNHFEAMRQEGYGKEVQGRALANDETELGEKAKSDICDGQAQSPRAVRAPDPSWVSRRKGSVSSSCTGLEGLRQGKSAIDSAIQR